MRPELAAAIRRGQTAQARPAELVPVEVQATGQASESASATAPLPKERAWPTMEREAFHGIAGRFVAAVEPHTEADPVALLVGFHVFAGNLIGRGPHFMVEATAHRANLFVVVVGRSAKSRKDTARGHVARLFREVDPEWCRGRVQEGLSSGEGLIWAVRDSIYRTERDRKTGAIEEVQADPGVSDKRLLVTESEFAGVLKATAREGCTLSPIVRRAYDGGEQLATMTKNSPARATDPHVSILGHITLEELKRTLTATEQANGFGNRFLWMAAKRSKLLPEGGAVPALDSIATELRAAAVFAQSAGAVPRDEAARRVWREAYPELSRERWGIVGALTSRAEAHAVRLSLLYALLDRSPTIRPEHLSAALAIVEYSIASVEHLFGGATGRPDTDAILAALRGRPAGMTQTEVSELFGRNASAGRIERALEPLIASGAVLGVTVSTAGRPATVYRLAEAEA